MRDWRQINDILQSAERTVRNGIAITHTLTTPEVIELERLLMDARYESEASERKARNLTAQLAAQRAIVAADDEAFAEWSYPAGDISAGGTKVRQVRGACWLARKEAKRIDEETSE